MPAGRTYAALLFLAAASACSQVTRRDELVVTGSAEPVPLEEADRSVELLPVKGRETLLRSIPDLLRFDPSVDLRARGTAGVQTDVSIRGGSFGQTLVLVDGLRLNDPQTGHHSMDIPLPLEALGAVEVLRGSGSTLYGSDAVGGVVNLITRRPEAGEARMAAAFGSFGTNQQRITLGAAAGRFAGQLAAMREFSSGFEAGRDYRNLSLAATGFARSGLGASRLVFAHQDKPFGADQFYGNFNSWERTRTWFASLRQEFGRRTEASFAYRRHSDLFVLERYRPQFYTNRHTAGSWQAAVRRTEGLGRNAGLHYGVEGLGEGIRSTNLGRHRRGRAAAYGSLDFRALGRFSLSIGAREEVYRRLAGQFSPTFSGGVWLSSAWKLRASASRAFRFPAYTELFYVDPANYGSPELRPEQAWSYEAGAEWNRWRVVRASLTVFRRQEKDVIDYVRASGAEPWRATNIHRLRFTGLEASVAWHPRPDHELGLGYTALMGTQGALEGLLSKYVFNYPSHSGVASWQATLPRGIVVRTRVGALNRRARPPYALWDVSATRGGSRLRPFLQLSNLTASRYQEIPGVAMPGRAVLGGVEVVLAGK